MLQFYIIAVCNCDEQLNCLKRSYFNLVLNFHYFFYPGLNIPYTDPGKNKSCKRT